MLALRCPVIGLKILLLLHTAQSFVLLTANIDDVKKLAMKFVSESFADRIASFVGRAAQRVITQVSDEIHKDSRDVSQENKQYKHAMSREVIDKLNEIKPPKGVFNSEEDNKYGPKKQPLQYAYTVNPKSDHKTKKNTTEKQRNNEKEQHKTELKKKRKHKQRNKNVEHDYGKNIDYKDHDKYTEHEKYNENTDQDNGKHKKVHEKHKYKSHYLNLNDKSNEINRIEENNSNQDSQYRVTYRANDLDGVEEDRRLPIVVLATSGGIMLTKVPTEKSLSIYGKKTNVK